MSSLLFLNPQFHSPHFIQSDHLKMQTWPHHLHPHIASSFLCLLCHVTHTHLLTFYPSDMVTEICLPLSFTCGILQHNVLSPSPIPHRTGFNINFSSPESCSVNRHPPHSSLIFFLFKHISCPLASWHSLQILIICLCVQCLPLSANFELHKVSHQNNVCWHRRP